MKLIPFPKSCYRYRYETLCYLIYSMFLNNKKIKIKNILSCMKLVL